MRILVAEDDEHLGEVLVRGPREQGYAVDLASDGESAGSFLRLYEYAAAVIDWRMPGLSGLDLIRQLREGRQGSIGQVTPVLMLTARDPPADRIAGLDGGADDYLVKPFDFGELLARLRALQRRTRPAQLRLKVGDLEFDPVARHAEVDGRSSPALTMTELGILETLMRRSPGVATRLAIAQQVWPDEADAFRANTLEVPLG